MHEKHFAEIGIQARWLPTDKARNAHAYALRYSHPKRYGLNEESVSGIDRLIISDLSAASRWLKERLVADGTVQIVCSEAEVAIMDTSMFLERWQDIFVPSRDDAVVLHNLSATVLFFCHEDEFEIGQRKDLLANAGKTRQ